ncbi:MAG: PAC2 family protein [Ilumatobacteraceae bacterium]
MDHVRWLARPTLQRPVIVAAFTGWNDAGDAASNSVRHLVETWQAKPLAEIEPEEFTDFATVRPHVRLDAALKRSIVWPTVGLWSASTPGGDVILMLGPEPALRWRLFVEEVLGVAESFGASMLLTLGALLADVPHTRPVRLIGTATDERVLSRYDMRRSRYEGPTGIVGVLHEECARNDLASASLWAAVPAYASQMPSPKASLALVERTCEILGCPAPTSRLTEAAANYETQVSSFVEHDIELTGYVARLESMTDTGELNDFDNDEADDDEADDDDDVEAGKAGDGGLFTGGDDLPENPVEVVPVDSDELMAEVERFLRDHGGPGQ